MRDRVRHAPLALGLVLVAACYGGSTSTATSVAAAARTERPFPLSALALRSPRAGRLPLTGMPVVAGISLPAGTRLIEGRDGQSVGSGAPLVWLTDAQPADLHALWTELAGKFAETGLWPVVLPEEPTSQGNDFGRPLNRSARTDPLRVHLQDVAASRWHDNTAGDLKGIAPFGASFPGLAPRTTGAPYDGSPVDVLHGSKGRIALVPVTQPADVPYAIGWQGSANYFDAGYVTAFLRSEESRWGAVLVEMGTDHLELALRRPAANLDQARAISAEQLAFCPDEVLQGDYDTLEEYAKALVGRTEISCWWD